MATDMKAPALTNLIGSQSVPLLDIQQENEPLLAELQCVAESVLASGRYVFGPECEALEQEVADLCGARFGIGCASGSDALLLSLMIQGIGPGDEVIVPSFTFFATASCVWRLGATPIFADIELETFNLDPVSVEAAVTPRTKAIIPVHLFGQCADMARFRDLGAAQRILVVEDAAQSIGARDVDCSAGSLADVACFSFYPTKNLGGFGDGGMLTTSDEKLANRLRLFRGHGMQPRYYHQEVGINSRLDALQAALLRVKLRYLDKWTKARQQNAQRYGEMFSEAGLSDLVACPITAEHKRHVWNQYTIRVLDGRRDELREHLTQVGVGTEIYYPVPLHQQACFASIKSQQPELRMTERAAREVLSLPISPTLTSEQQGYVVEQIRNFLCG